MASGPQALAPTLVAPGHPSTTEPAKMLRAVIDVPGGGGSANASHGRLASASARWVASIRVVE